MRYALNRTLPCRSRAVATYALLLIAGFIGGAGGCGGTKVKPIPVIYGPGRADICARVVESHRTGDIQVFYATNRVARGPADKRTYTNGIDDRLHLGVATVRLGDQKTTWDDISRASLGKGGNLAFRFTRAAELGQLGGGGGGGGADDAAADAFVEAVNRQLDSTNNHEVNIYIHGFRTSMEPEVEVLAKLLHFTGRGGAMICFAWPARQSLMLYGSDVERGKKSAHYLADLIELLARRTDAESINVLAYSAGAVATADALCQLRDRYPDDDADALSKRLRIGNVIFAASDLDLQAFAREQLNRIEDIGQNTIIYIAANDAALGFASFGAGASRLGRPDLKALHLSKEQVEQAAKDTSMQVVDVTDVPGPHAGFGGFRGHGYWYANDWIMTDLLVVLRWQIPAGERGLVRKPGMARWFFPKDYPTRVYDAVHQLARQPTTSPATPTTQTTSAGGS